MNELSNKQTRHLRSLAHDLKPVVIIGDKGLTQGVIDEIDNALEVHELIKVKVRADEREERQKMISSVCKRTKSEFIQRVGHIVILFRRNKESKIAIPKG
jgi:RNA-binding protein